LKKNKINFEKGSKEFEKNSKKLNLIFIIVAIPIFIYTYYEIYTTFPNLDWYMYSIYAFFIAILITFILFEVGMLTLILLPIFVIFYTIHQIFKFLF
jgi:uncharacterized membrane protein